MYMKPCLLMVLVAFTSCVVCEFTLKNVSLWLILLLVHTHTHTHTHTRAPGFDRRGENEDFVWVYKIRLIFNCIVYVDIRSDIGKTRTDLP